MGHWINTMNSGMILRYVDDSVLLRRLGYKMFSFLDPQPADDTGTVETRTDDEKGNGVSMIVCHLFQTAFCCKLVTHLHTACQKNKPKWKKKKKTKT